MRVLRTVAVAMVGLGVLVGATACGSSSSGGSTSAAQNQRPAELDSGPAADAAAKAPAAGAPGAASSGGGAQPAQQPVSAQQRHVVRTAQLSIEVDDVYRVARRVYELGDRFGGYVADEKTGDDGAMIQLRVESDELDAAMAAAAELGTKVTARSQQAEDVTEQVVDVEARVVSQQASVERVRALLGNATGLGEIVQIESELTRRQADLESLQRRAAALSGQAQLATLTVNLHRPGGVTRTEEDEAGFLDGLTSGWKVFVASTEVLLTVLGALLPFLIALAIPIAVIVSVLRRRRPAVPTVTPAPGATGGR